MNRILTFTDGFILQIVGEIEGMKPAELYPYMNSVILISLDGVIYTLWEGTKIDNDNNKWTITKSERAAKLIIRNDKGEAIHNIPDLTITNDKNQVLFLWGTNSDINGSYLVWEKGLSSFFEGKNSVNQDFTESYGKYPNEQLFNFLTTGSMIIASGQSEYIRLGGGVFYYEYFANSIEQTSEIDDPYMPGGTTGTGGGNGDFDGTSEPIDIPELPMISSVDSGFISLFNPTNIELKNLANYMWSDLFDIATWKKIFADPMDAILGLSIVPVSVPDGGNSELTVGNIPTGISMKRAASQYVSVDCGSLNVNEFWGAYLDYEPFTKAELYLPYIGIHTISVDDIMGKTIQVVYHVDILSGACCAYVKCGSSVLYSFVGQCSSSIPITGNDWTNVINGALSIATSIGTMVATGGASAPLAIGSLASTAVNHMKPSIEKSGSMGGTGGLLGIQAPYLILTRPRQAIPLNQNVFMGYPSFISGKLSSLKGYTEIESIHLENIPATEQELSEIVSLLKSGVII